MPQMKGLKNADKEIKVKKSGRAEREVVYPELRLDLCHGESAVTAEDARELLGWQEVPEGGGSYSKEVYALSKSLLGEGVRARFNRNVINRWITTGNLQDLIQKILRGHWAGPNGTGGTINGETIIIGRTAQVLDGQHTLISLVLADLMWRQDKSRWSHWRDSPPVIDKLVISGVDEDDHTANSINVCKSRSKADVLYRSEFFAHLDGSVRKVQARMSDYATRLLWLRIGIKYNAMIPRITHDEVVDFIGRHQRLLQCITHVYEENGSEGKISRYVGPGYAAGLLYLMACSASDPSTYRAAEQPTDDLLGWGRWSDACDFWVMVASGDAKLKAVHEALARDDESRASNAEVWAIFANAWLAVINGEPVTAGMLELVYDEDDWGNRRLAEQPSVGGIDLGDPSTMDEADVEMPDPSPKEIKRGAAKQRGKKEDKDSPRPSTGLGPPRKAGFQWTQDDVAWVCDDGGEHFVARLAEDPIKCEDGETRVMVVTGKGEEWEVRLEDLSLDRPGKTSPPAESPKADGPRARRKQRAKPKTSAAWDLGDQPWVDDPDHGVWRGRIVELGKTAAKVKVNSGCQGAGSVRVVALADLLRQQPRKHGAA